MKFLSLRVAVIIFLLIGSNLFLAKSCTNRQTEKVVANKQEQENVKDVHPLLDKREWIPPTYLGLTLGKSTENDVKKLFGKPKWEGSREEKIFESDSENEILLDYVDVKEVDGDIAITIGEKTRIVKAIAVYSNENLTKQEIISKYGSDFYEIESSESMCIKDDHPPGESNRKMQYPIVLVYPNKGMYVFINEDNKLIYRGFLVKCPVRTD